MDGRTLSVKEWENLAARFLALQISVVLKKDLIGELWLDRPSQPSEKVWLLEDASSGESRRSKIARVRDIMTGSGWTHYLLSSLDDIAWLMNIRGGDVPYNPVVQSYCLLTEDRWTGLSRKKKSPNPSGTPWKPTGFPSFLMKGLWMLFPNFLKRGCCFSTEIKPTLCWREPCPGDENFSESGSYHPYESL